jgi:hypothetical protein
VHERVTEDEFVVIRIESDQPLGMPRCILPSGQVNLRATSLLETESHGVHHHKILLNVV